MQRIRVAVVEDDPAQIRLIQEYLERYQKESASCVLVETTVYTDGYEIVDGYAGGFDIILMDIEMGLMNGMEAAGEIRKKDEEVIIIFITNMSQYAIQGYSVGALDYILKPISYTAFTQTLRKAARHIRNTRGTFVTIPWRDGMIKLHADNITRIESQGHRLTFYTRSAPGAAAADRTRKQQASAASSQPLCYETTVYSMKEMEEKLSGEGFMRCNSGCLVNLRQVDGIQGNNILVDGQLISLSRGRKAGFLDALARTMT